jgi:membrane protease YdiL (CAAX protease family)
MLHYKAYPPETYQSPAPQAGASQHLIRHNANIVGIGGVLMTVISLLLAKLLQLSSPFLASLLPGRLLEAFGYFISLSVYAVSLAVPCAVMVLLLRIPVKVAFPLRAPRPDILAAAIFICMGVRIIGMILASRVTSVAEMIGGLTPPAPVMAAPAGVTASILYFISVVIAPAFLEEAVFRGVMLQSLRRFGDGFAVVCSSILFALLHGNLLQSPYPLLLGLLIGYFVVRTGSVWAGVAIHFANNLLALVLEYLYVALEYQVYDIFSTVFLFGSVALAAAGLVYLRIRYGSVFYFMQSGYPLAGYQKYFSFFSSAFVLAVIAIAICRSLLLLI